MTLGDLDKQGDFDNLTSDSNSGCETTSKNTPPKFFPRGIGLAKIFDKFCRFVGVFNRSWDPPWQAPNAGGHLKIEWHLLNIVILIRS
ncbi:uncharacterized protein LACBIDRAFT_314520 [Laccaria bicolor S238N-H82]|uniref:Predicted protein n=1 Tax=Laccaria bicolor (strain S238N-H82 / ATCC MYA-4686) TaxID=486041 RepID=B0DYR2_LACBS|nr:uncharacterized protein LACBIDRAFT_314520 [Laccaria bicolor S238N-H82]EDR00293.1 predicted protein [Laccaria bicolor S238N-H82]|eukprot:XP_001889045.1 predicted protein [Laccaria bicolor S238N-H82]